MMIVDGINYYYHVCQIVIFEFHHSFDVIISCFFFFFFFFIVREIFPLSLVYLLTQVHGFLMNLYSSSEFYLLHLLTI